MVRSGPQGRSVSRCGARQLGHDARLTLARYGHTIDELQDTPRMDADAAIANARLAVRTSGPAEVRDFGAARALVLAGRAALSRLPGQTVPGRPRL